MTAVIPVFPDIELLLVAGLTSLMQAQLGANGIRVVTILPASVSLPTLRVKRISGASRNIALDRPVVDFDVFTSNYGQSSLIARQASAALLALRGEILPNGVITNVNVVQGPRWLPDPDPNLFRFNASYEVFTHG